MQVSVDGVLTTIKNGETYCFAESSAQLVILGYNSEYTEESKIQKIEMLYQNPITIVGNFKKENIMK